MASIVSESYNGNGNARKNVTKEQMAQGVATGNTIPPLVVQSVADRMSAQGNPTDFTGMPAPSGWGSNVSQPQQSVQQPMVVPTNVFSSGGNVLQGRFENVPATGDISARQQIMGSNVFAPQQGYANVSPQNQTDFSNMPSPYSGNGWGSKPVSVSVNGRAGELNYGAQNNVPGVVNPSLVSNNNLSALQAALQGATGNAVDYQKDKTKRDGGFSQWIKNTFGTKGPRDGESEEEYDYRTTQNKKRLMALADAMRHFGNIYNTTRYAPAQQFNSPMESVEKDYQTRSALRQAKAKQDADNAYKQYKLEQDAAKNENDKAYKNLLLQLNMDKFNRQKERDAANDDHWNKNYDRLTGNDKFNHNMAERKQGETENQNKIKNAQAQQRISISASKKSGSGGGSGGKYWFDDHDGKRHYQPNKTMWEQEFFREYGFYPTGGETSISTSTKTIDPKTGQETTITSRKKGESNVSKAAAEQNKAKKQREGAKKHTNLNALADKWRKKNKK